MDVNVRNVFEVLYALTKEFTEHKKTGFSQFHLSTLKLIRQENKIVSEVNRNEQQSAEVRMTHFEIEKHWHRKHIGTGRLMSVM